MLVAENTPEHLRHGRPGEALLQTCLHVLVAGTVVRMRLALQAPQVPRWAARVGILEAGSAWEHELRAKVNSIVRCLPSSRILPIT